jgi:acyl-CoA synthetase (AMP-forming)/AMP-acid ligase II
MKGYYKNPEATAEANAHGWFHTGDLGFRDSDGYYYVVDRAKDMIITGGFNVYSTEVEAAILTHPAVQECAIIGVPDEKWGEAIKAVVELKSGEQLDAETLIQHCKAAIGSVKAPKSVDFIDEIPRSPVGKVLKRELRARYWSELDRQVG